MPKFRKKPVVIEATQYRPIPPIDKSSLPEVPPDWFVDGINNGTITENRKDKTLTIKTLEGDHIACSGDWIIQGVQGELYPCKPDIFEATYEPA